MTSRGKQNIFDIKEKKYACPYSENVTRPSEVDTSQKNIRCEVKEGLDYILRHLDGSQFPFPRNIMTRRLKCQVEVWDRDSAIREFELSDWRDCRINAYHLFTKFKGISFTAPSIVFIDLDLQHFRNQRALDRALTKTLRLIQNTVRSGAEVKPTVLWTGNGYHIYLPISGLVLEEESVFAEFVTPLNTTDLTTKFMRFAEQYFTGNKQDPNHKPSVKNCLLRIPGTYNSKNRQQVRIVKQWNGYRVPIQYMLREFRRHLIQERIDNYYHNKTNQITKQQNSFTNWVGQNYTYKQNQHQNGLQSIHWIESLLQTSVSDDRKYCIWHILAPYLVKVKNLSDEEVYSIIVSWLKGCSKLERLSFNCRSRVRDDIRRARRVRCYPISLKNLQKENLRLYRIVTENRR